MQNYLEQLVNWRQLQMLMASFSWYYSLVALFIAFLHPNDHSSEFWWL
jgi:hypothetical protein